MYGETALPGSIPALFHDIFFNLSISTDSDFPDFRTRISEHGFQNTDFRTRISEITFFIFLLFGPLCTQRILKNGADSKKRRFANLIQELL